MHSKTPSAPVLPGAITADQKKKERKEKKKSMITAVTKQKPNKREKEKVRDKFNTRNDCGEDEGKHLLLLSVWKGDAIQQRLVERGLNMSRTVRLATAHAGSGDKRFKLRMILLHSGFSERRNGGK